MKRFNLNDHLPYCEVQTIKFNDGTPPIYYKELQLLNGLKLFLFEGGEATLAFESEEGNAEYTFYWDDNAAKLFDNFYVISAVDLFGLLYNKRWKAVI